MSQYTFFIAGTTNLGDFLNVVPVLSGLNKQFGKYELVIISNMRKFNGIREFLQYQDLFTNVAFHDEVDFTNKQVVELSCSVNETRLTPDRPTETCRYVNFVKEKYNFDVLVDDDYVLK